MSKEVSVELLQECLDTALDLQVEWVWKYDTKRNNSLFAERMNSLGLLIDELEKVIE